MVGQWKRTAKVVGLVAGLALSALLQGCVPLVAGGVAGAASVLGERRSSGTIIEDEGIENSALLEAKRRYPDGTHLNITSFNRIALITGEVFNEEQKKAVEALVRQNRNVKDVYNELSVQPVASFGGISVDSGITAKVKARMVDTKGFSAHHVKVVTERGIVYLMGLVNRTEAGIATDVARTTSGAVRVVRLFEYID